VHFSRHIAKLRHAQIFYGSVADLHQFDANPDPSFHLNAVPDPAFQFKADSDPDPAPH
jgi:hypothetical protein